MITMDMECRPGCAACCVYISISSALPGMPKGKPAGVRCVNLDNSNRCLIYGSPIYPAVCKKFTPSKQMCGSSDEEAMKYLQKLEEYTTPSR